MLQQVGQPLPLSVEVLNTKGDFVHDAKVILRPQGEGDVMALRFDDESASYIAREVPPGPAVLEVEHPSLQSQTRELTIGPTEARELFILGEPGSKTYFREKVRVPVDADADLFAISMAHGVREDLTTIDALVEDLGLEPQRISDLTERAGVRLFRAASSDIDTALQRLSDEPRIEHAGAVVGMREEGFSFLTRDIVVRFRGPRAEGVRAIAEEHGYAVVRELPYAPSTYVLRWGQVASLEILDSIEMMASRDDVEWAEPSLVVTPELDAIVPTDFLWPGLWDRQLVGVQDAWQHLQDAGLDTFGDPDIVLAIWDSGVQSIGGVPTSADFTGNLSNGAPKVLAAFDFDNMVPNNDNPWDNHGSGVAGVSVALANNPAPVGGAAYGLVGSAPNVQIMTIAGRTPHIDIEVADQYIWMSGFDPQSQLIGFPATPPPRGADVITCSLVPGAGAPLSGAARAALDFVTTFGRGGKGTLCFFSTGNNNQNNITARPYGAYEKCFGIAATSFADDGVTEIRAPYSGWGQIALCSPSQDQYPPFHNPPTGFAPWGAHHQSAGNLISFAQSETTLTTPTATGATALTVADVTGFSVGSVIQVGAVGTPGSEPGRVVAVNGATNLLTIEGFNVIGATALFTGGLLNAHGAGAPILTGPANHRNNFGGTSSATPLCAGVAALVLSANPELTYIEARQILRDTTVKFDLANTNATGRWLDANGNPSVVSGLPEVKSGWYGYGRVNAAAAVQTALSFGSDRDLVIRDSLADTGMVASVGAFWDSPDIWCRGLSPAVDAAALPPNYATAGPHVDPTRGQSNWIYVRIRNNGSDASLDAWVRISVTHFPGMEFTYPAAFQPSNGPGDPLPSPMVPGTYFIGEAKVTGIAPWGTQIVSVEWPAGLIPPATVMTASGTVNWHPCLLVEITPHDGPTPTGNHVWDNNNLAQKNISIVGTDAGADFRIATVVGNEGNPADCLVFEINRGHLPREVQLFVDLLDPVLRRRLRRFDQKCQREALFAFGAKAGQDGIQGDQWPELDRRQSWRIGWHEGREVVFLQPQPRVRVPVVAGQGRIVPLVVGGIVESGTTAGTYEVVMIQRQPDGEPSGSATMQVKIGKQEGY